MFEIMFQTAALQSFCNVVSAGFSQCNIIGAIIISPSFKTV